MDAALLREVRFRASHHYSWPDRSPEENRALFGDQVAPHEHEWRLRVEVRGAIDPNTGFVTDLAALDEALEGLIGSWRDGDLNERIPEVREGRMQPSTEALARWLYDRLTPEIRGPGRLALVEVWESARVGARYPA